MKHITLGIFAQVDAGKTTLTEALLYKTNEIKELGRVDHGDTRLDHHALERNRGITIFSKQARFQTGELSVTLLDTPGHVDFSPEAERAMQVLDYAILLISGTDGVQAHTETLWRLLRHYRIPTLIFFNKMDLPGLGRETLLAQVRQHLHDGCAAPEDMEVLALCDENALEVILNGELPSLDLLRSMVRRQVWFPCFFGSALRLEGIEPLLTALETYTEAPTYPTAFSAKIYKIDRDPQGNRLTHLRVTGGTLRVRDLITYIAKDGTTHEEKVNQIRLYSGKTYQQTDQAAAGTVCAVLGMTALQAGDVLGSETKTGAPVLTPVMTYRICLPEGVDPAIALPKLRQLEEEEPQLRIVWNERLAQIQAQIMGQVQLEILQCLISDRFGWDVLIDNGQVSYRETIANTVEGVGHFEPLRHYAEVHLILEPLPQGSGLEFAVDCSEDALDRNWQRLILTHLIEKTHVGVLTGSPITDMKLTLVAGRAHLKHTEGGDFRQATYRAVRQGLMQAESVLLEPYYHFCLTVPAAQIGRAINDIRSMGGSFGSPTESADGMTLEGSAPAVELQSYLSQVVAYTHGHGKLFCRPDGYAPCHNTAEVLQTLAYDPESDTEHPSGSVFCSHGAGIHIKWDQVQEHMHLESVLRSREADEPIRVRTQNLDLDEKELQAIMEREFGPEKRVLYRPTPVQSEEKVQLAPPKKKYLIVDGYNMIFAWDGLREQAAFDLAGAREGLLDILSNYCGFHPCELVVVFDSYRVKGGTGSKSRHDNLRVVYTQEHESADLYIETLVGQIGRNYTVSVATSDAMVQLSALRSGVLRVSAGELFNEVQRSNEEIKAFIRQLQERTRRTAKEHSPMKKLEDLK